MHRITLLTVGRLKETWARQAAELYIERLRPNVQLQVMELAPSKGRQAAQQQIEESQRLLAMLEKMEGEKIILDERGKGMTSRAFSTLIAHARDHGTPITFVLGGAYGLMDTIRTMGHLLKLSDMTLPHELCRVVFLEQLYRAVEIGRGSGYHH